MEQSYAGVEIGKSEHISPTRYHDDGKGQSAMCMDTRHHCAVLRTGNAWHEPYTLITKL